MLEESTGGCTYSPGIPIKTAVTSNSERLHAYKINERTGINEFWVKRIIGAPKMGRRRSDRHVVPDPHSLSGWRWGRSERLLVESESRGTGH